MSFTKCVRSVACIAIGSLMLALGHSTDAQGCGGGGMGCSRGGMGGGYPGSGYPGGGYPGGGYMHGTGSQNASPQQVQSSSPSVSLNNPATVLAHTTDLKLTDKQVQALDRMLSSGKQHAALVLTQAQRKQLAGIVGTVRKSGSTGTSPSSNLGTSAIAGSP